MFGVTQSPGARSILQSLQSAAAQESVTQNRLATGRRVNSALDNPTSFFTAQSLQQRAGDLGVLLDQMSQAQQTINAANNGIGAIAKLVEAAKSVVLQARRAPLPQTTYAAITQTGANASETIGSVTGSVDTSGAFSANVDGLQIQIGATTYTVHAAGAGNINSIIGAINATVGGQVNASLDSTGRHLKLTAANSDVSFDVLASGAASALGVAGQSGTSANLLDVVGGLSGTSLTVQANSGGTRTITFGTGSGAVSRFSELQSALSGSGVSATLAGGNLTLTVASTAVVQNSLTTGGSAAGALGLPGGTDYGAVQAPVPDVTRTASQAQYNTLLQQIDALVGDANFGGINLLNGDTLTTTFNASGSSTLAVAGPLLTAAGMSLTAATGSDFQSNTVVDRAIDATDAALAKLRVAAGALGSSLTTLQTRQSFTRSIISTLQGGADALTLADTNAEGAHLLALQVRKSLSLTALSLAVQSQQSVVSLLR